MHSCNDGGSSNTKVRLMRILIFDTDISHKMISATDTKRRIIINLNYFQNQNYMTEASSQGIKFVCI